jgi:hypothetical protein
MTLRAAVVLLAVAAATPQIQYFQYERPLTISGKSGAPRQTCAILDAGLFAHTALGFADLRLYRTGGEPTETPYAIQTSAPQAAQQQQTLAPLNLGSKDGATSFDTEMPEDAYSDITLQVTGQNFIATVNVQGRHAAGGAGQDTDATQLGSFTIFDLTDQKLGRSTVLHLPESNFRTLHFEIAGPVTPQQVGGVVVERLPQTQQQYVVVAESAHGVQQGHETVIKFQVPARVPVDRIEFVPGAEPANFSRDVSVKVAPIPAQPLKSEEDVPRTIDSSGTILRVHGTHDRHRIDEEHLSVDAPWVDFGKAGALWTLTIDNGDDPPVSLKWVRLEMAERTLCFDAAPGASYTLFYGDAALSAPRYDYARLFMPEAAPSQASLGPEEENPQHQSRPDDRPFTERHPWLLSVALVLVVLVLGAIALRTAKQSRPTQQP